MLILSTAVPTYPEIVDQIKLSQTRYVKVDVAKGTYEFVNVGK